MSSQLNQRSLVERARRLGWHLERITVFDADLGVSASQADCRDDFKAMISEVALGHVGIVFGWDASRLARNNADWYQLLDLAALFGTLIGDNDGIYDPRLHNDRLLLGLKGTLSEAKLYTLHQRLKAGRLSKVQRGEYAQRLPTGLIHIPQTQQVVKDPDIQVQHVIDLIFTKFEELGSCPKVMRYCRDHNVLLPRHQTSGYSQGQTLWKKPSVAIVYEVITNPAYAGAFVYGRRPTDPTRRKPGRPATGTVRKPMSEWHIIQSVYPAYISWEQYMANQSQLQENTQRYIEQSGGQRGVPRQGAALLQGLATCGCCGRRMKVCYKPGVRYACEGLAKTFGEPMCAHLDGPSIETFVVQAFFEAIAPAQLDALDEVMSQQNQEHSRLENYHQQQIQRAQYDVNLARRRYEQVDPDNRLVAAALEQQWETQLQALQAAQEAAHRFTQKTVANQIPPQIRQQFSDLNQHLPQIWSSEQLTNEQRKQLLRSLIARVILKRTAPDQVLVKIVWVSGHFSEGVVTPPIWRQADATQYTAILELTERLWRQGQTDLQIAQALNQAGFRTARNLQFKASSVMKIRRQQQWPSQISQHKGAEKMDGMWTVQGLATHLGVSIFWIYNRIQNGFLSSDVVVRRPAGFYLIADDAALIIRLRQAVKQSRSTPQSNS
ncbi:MAG: recombinase family protein [Cyanobacteria bacterium P01_D01_bin.56]